MKALKELVGLNNLEIRVFEVVRTGDVRAEKIAKQVQRDISSVNRAINTLIKVSLVTRESRCCDEKKGRYFVYSVEPDFKRILKDKLIEFQKEMVKDIGKL
jgi:predicted transcriptional regulator